MPGFWYDSERDPDYFEEYPVNVGDILEIGVFDDYDQEQGIALLCVEEKGVPSPRGRWYRSTYISASDGYFRYYMTSPESHPNPGWYHHCRGPPAG